MPYSKSFTAPEILAMAGYQLNPGHSDLDDRQHMSVRLHDGLWDERHLSCTLGDIHQAKRDFYAGLKTQLVASLLLGAAKPALAILEAEFPAQAPGEPESRAIDGLRAAIAQAVAA